MHIVNAYYNMRNATCEHVWSQLGWGCSLAVSGGCLRYQSEQGLIGSIQSPNNLSNRPRRLPANNCSKFFIKGPIYTAPPGRLRSSWSHWQFYSTHPKIYNLPGFVRCPGTVPTVTRTKKWPIMPIYELIRALITFNPYTKFEPDRLSH